MKKLVSLLMALALLALAIPALGEAQTYQYDAGSFYGVVYQAKPNGFGTLMSSDQKTVNFGVMKNDDWDGPLFQVKVDEKGDVASLWLLTMNGGETTSAIRFSADGSNDVYLYENNAYTQCLRLDAKGNYTLYHYANGEMTGKELVTAENAKGTLLEYGFMTLYAEQTDKGVKIYAYNTQTGIYGPQVYEYTDGTMFANCGYNGAGPAYYYEPTKDYYFRGICLDGVWQDDLVKIYPDGREEAMEEPMVTE